MGKSTKMLIESKFTMQDMYFAFDSQDLILDEFRINLYMGISQKK